MGNKKINKVEMSWDPDFAEELLKRSKEFAEGTVKTYTWEETKQAAIERIVSKRKSVLPVQCTGEQNI